MMLRATLYGKKINLFGVPCPPFRSSCATCTLRIAKTKNSSQINNFYLFFCFHFFCEKKCRLGFPKGLFEELFLEGGEVFFDLGVEGGDLVWDGGGGGVGSVLGGIDLDLGLCS